ncbi:MAG: alpha/beta fold hydrolase [Nodosilinea sp.]
MHLQPYFSGFTPLSAGIEARLLPEAKPLHQEPSSRTDAVVICVHGFTGTPYEVAPAVDVLATTGIAAVAPLLPGHGYQIHREQKQEFAQIRPEGMLAAVRQEVARAREQYARVGMLGFSMGGAIALAIAAEGLLDACAVVAPALRLPRAAEILIPLLGWASFTVPARHREPFYIPGYEFYHPRALQTLWQLSCQARNRLVNVQCPVLAVHSRNDLTVPPIVLDLMQAHIPAAIETAWFNDSGHSMLLDVSGSKVAFTLANFFQRQLIGRAFV